MSDEFNYMTNDPPEAGFEGNGRLFLVSFAEPPHDVVASRELVIMHEYLKFLIKHRMIIVSPELESMDTLKKVILEQYQKEIDNQGLELPELTPDTAELHMRLDPFEHEFMQVLSTKYDEFKFSNQDALKELASRIHPEVMFNRAMKIRGSAPNTPDGLKYLKERAELLGNIDGKFDVSAGEMYKWGPFNPDVSLIKDQNTRDKRMNDILRGYMHNQEQKAEFLEKLRQEEIKKMEEKNRVRKEEQRAMRKKLIQEQLDAKEAVEEDTENACPCDPCECDPCECGTTQNVSAEPITQFGPGETDTEAGTAGNPEIEQQVQNVLFDQPNVEKKE